MSARLTILLLLLPLAVAGQTPLAGRIENGFYLSATGAFRIPIPVSPALGGRVYDTENVVTFEDNYDTHISIACFALDLTQKWELESRGRQAYLNYFFTTYVFPDFERRYPGSSVEETRFIPQLHEGVLAAYCLLPGGSYFDQRNLLRPDNPGVHQPATAKRGNLLFVKNGHVFVLSAELAERVNFPSTHNLDATAENDRLQERLTALSNRLVFHAPPATAR